METLPVHFPLTPGLTQTLHLLLRMMIFGIFSLLTPFWGLLRSERPALTLSFEPLLTLVTWLLMWLCHFSLFSLCHPSSLQGHHLISHKFVWLKIWVFSTSAVHCKSILLLLNLLLVTIWLPSKESVHWSTASILPPPLFHSCYFNFFMASPQPLLSSNLLLIMIWLPFEVSVCYESLIY